MRGAVGLVAIAAAVLCEPRISDACSPAPCGRAYFVPATSSTVPANTPALSWRSQSAYENTRPRDPALVTLATTSDPATLLPLTPTQVRSTPFDSDWHLVLAQPLVQGTSYTVTDKNVCNPGQTWLGATSTFSVGAAAPLPSQLGTLTRAPTELGVLEVDTSSGSCTAPAVAASVKLQLELSAEAAPWRDALHYETFVDGQRWFDGSLGFGTTLGSNGQGRGRDLVFRVCYSDDPNVSMGLGPDIHVVTMRATLPGTSVVLVTPPVSVQLECPAAPLDVDITDIDTDAAATGCGCATNSASPIGSLLLALAASFRLIRRGPGRRG